MVTPASPAGARATDPNASQSKKNIDIKGLKLGFQSLLLNALASRCGQFGPMASAGFHGPKGVPNAGHARLVPKASRPSSGRAGRAEAELDPLARSLALPGLLPAPPVHSPAFVASPLPNLADARVLEDAVRRIAWGGDRRRGVARLELGGSYEGTVVIVQGEGREVALRLELGPGAAVNRLPERLVERLAARGLTVTEVEVT
jgi:hypothetical protein